MTKENFGHESELSNPYENTDCRASRFATRSAKVDGRSNTLLPMQILVCVMFAIPGTLLAPFAVWLLIASIVQLLRHAWIGSILVLVFCTGALCLLSLTWMFVFFGSRLVPREANSTFKEDDRRRFN